MNYPTGMGQATGMQFNEVARQMNAYLNGPQRPPAPHPIQPPRRHVSPFQGPFPMPRPVGPMLVPFGPRPIPFHPGFSEGIGSFARDFIRDMF